MKDVKVLVFDLDGVLIDNTLPGFVAINSILEKIGMLPVKEDLLRQYWGMPLSELINVICHEQDASSKKQAKFMEKIKKVHIETRIDPRLARVLKAAPDYGFLTGIITSRTRVGSEIGAEKHGLDLGMFHFLQTISDYPACKPEADVFKPLFSYIYEVSDYGPHNVAYFGDTINYDLASVRNARSQGRLMKFIAVCSGVNKYEEFKRAGLDDGFIVPSYAGLSYYLDKL